MEHVLKDAENCNASVLSRTKKKFDAGIIVMQLYPKIILSPRLGSLCFSKLPYAEIIFSFPREFGHSSLASIMVKTPQILGIFPPSSPWGSVLVCLFCFPPIGVTCPGPGSWVISHDLTPDPICGLGRWQVFLGHMVLCQWSGFHN